MKKKKNLVIMSHLTFLTFSVFLLNAFALVPPEFIASYSTNYPVIDGYVTDSEWNDANSYEISLVSKQDGTEVSATVYFKHCNVEIHNIFIGLKVSDGDHDSNRFGFYFDEGDDGSYGSGTRDGVLTYDQEDAKSCFSPAISGYTTMDGCYKEGIDGVWCLYTGGDFIAACVYVAPDSHWECEFAIPFVGNDGGTGDISDLVCTIADCIGIKIVYSTADNAYFYPAGNVEEIETYTTLIFVPSAPTIESCDSTGAKKDTFFPGEYVYAVGEGYKPLWNFAIHVVEDVTTWTDGMAIPPRVPGTAFGVASDSDGNIDPWPVWDAPLTIGKYDIVVDVNGNGMYDEGIDALDDGDIEVTAGFHVIPEVPLGTAMASGAMIIALVSYIAFARRRRRL